VIPVDPPQPAPDDEPPFLRRLTEPMLSTGAGSRLGGLSERIQELLDRWGTGLVSFLVPAVMVLGAAAWVSELKDEAPEAAGENGLDDPSAVEAEVAGVSPQPDDPLGLAGSSRSGPTTSRTSAASTTSSSSEAGNSSDELSAVPSTDTTDPGDDGSDGTADSGPGTDGSTGDGSDTTTASTTTTTAGDPETTAAPTTPAPETTTTSEAPTTVTEPPETTDDLCLVTVRRRTTLRAEPSSDADDLGQVGGIYQVAAVSGSGDNLWYQISTSQAAGWVPASRGWTLGDCG
jgi:hypothetical protein